VSINDLPFQNNIWSPVMVTSFVYFEMQNNLICTRNHFETKILKIRDIKYRYKDFPEIGVL
jgi:hypothetical protein